MPKETRNTEQDKSLTTSEYLNCREGYNKAELEVSGRYDNWILTLSGGALAISITFIEKIAPAPRIQTLPWLILSWLLFIVSLLCGLISLLTSQSAIREQRRKLDNGCQCNPPDGKDRDRFTNLTNRLNWGSALVFIAGVSCLCVFAVTNVPRQKGGQMTDNKRSINRRSSTERHVPPSAPKIIELGFVPPTPPKQPAKPSAPTATEKK